MGPAVFVGAYCASGAVNRRPQVGAWAALQEAETACTGGGSFATLVVDTEGMLAATENEAIRARLLLKMLAICDVCLFTTKAERLHSDMFLFLERASKVGASSPSRWPVGLCCVPSVSLYHACGCTRTCVRIAFPTVRRPRGA